VIVIGFAVLSILPRLFATDNFSGRDRKYVKQLLHTIQNDLDLHYFDPTFHGVDMKSRSQEAESRIQNSKSYREAWESLEWLLEGLNDSHTFFIPPHQSFQLDYGFAFQFYGNTCYITEVERGSDAEKKGLRVGDRLLDIDGQKISRNEYTRLMRSLNSISPRAVMHLVVLPPEEANLQTITVETNVHPLPQLLDPESTRDSGFNINWRLRNLESLMEARKPASAEVGDVLVWRQPAFLRAVDLSTPGGASSEPLGERPAELLAQANHKRGVVLDLRGNFGGTIRAEQWLLAGVFDHDVHAYDVVSRTETKPETVKSHGKNAFTGLLVVLVDNNSRSAAEVFARVIQIEKRGIVIGDHTPGLVRESIVLRHNEFQAGSWPQYAVSVSVADLIMPDGKSLEGTGVTPDILLLPSQQDLATGRDPVLAEALKILGHPVDPEQAGKLLRGG
jgi:C-terminal processing protease CtpA/Prc